MSVIRKLFFILFFITASLPFVDGQEVPAYRQFDEEKIKELRTSFPYEVAEPAPEGAFQRFWQRMVSWFWSIFGNENTGSALRILFRLLLLAAFVFFIIKLTGTEISSIFKPSKPAVHLEVGEEQLGEIDFDAAIAQARQSQDWRLTVRLIYLKSLKFLWEREIISVKKGKTNREYLYELSGKDLASDFERLSFLFDYTWYGHFDATEVHAQKAEDYCSKITKGGVGEKG